MPVLLALVATGPATADLTGDWRQDGGGESRAGHQPAAWDLRADTAGRLTHRWSAPATRPGEQVGGAVVVDGTLFRASGGESGQVRRYDAAVGTDLGPVVDAPGRWFTQLAVVDGRVLVEARAEGGPERFLTAYTMEGHRSWEVAVGEDEGGGFVVGDGLVVRSAAGQVSAFHLATGQVVWQAPVDGDIGPGSPVLLAGRVLQAYERDAHVGLVALDARTGRRLWQRSASGRDVIGFDELAITTGDGGVCAFDVADGVERWCTSMPYAQHASAAPGAVYAVDGDGHLVALRLADGRRLWRRPFSVGWEVATSFWSPVNGGGVLYAVVYHFGRHDGTKSTEGRESTESTESTGSTESSARHRYELLAVDTADGLILRRIELDFTFLQGGEPLVLAGDLVYFAAIEKLYAFGVSAP